MERSALHRKLKSLCDRIRCTAACRIIERADCYTTVWLAEIAPGVKREQRKLVLHIRLRIYSSGWDCCYFDLADHGKQPRKNR